MSTQRLTHERVTVALFIRAQKWKQLGSPSTCVRILILWHIHATTQINIESMLSKRSQTQQSTVHVLQVNLCDILQKEKLTYCWQKANHWLSGAWKFGKAYWNWLKRDIKEHFEIVAMYYILSVLVVIWEYKYIKIHGTVHL